MMLTVALAALELVSPVGGKEVRLLPECQLTVITNESLEVRRKIFEADRAAGKKLRHDPNWRQSVPVPFRWKATAGERGPWEVLVSKNPDMSGARQFLFRGEKVDAATGRETGPDAAAAEHVRILPHLNLEIGTRYYWRVTSDVTCGKFGHARKCPCEDRRPSVSSAIGTFVTEDLAPRWIAVEGTVGNFRDLGGRIGLGGRRVRQGMIYRSQGLNDNSIDGIEKGKNRLTVTDVEYLTETLGIRTDLDLRTDTEVAGMNGVSPLGKDVGYVHRSSSSYRGVFRGHGKKVMAENFRTFLDKANYPILFHCIGGADRTGALGYVLNGVLGVKRQELETDWESTFYPKIPYKDAKGALVWNSEEHFNDGFAAFGDEKSSWNDRIVLYLKSCGITDAEIAAFRELMLEK